VFIFFHKIENEKSTNDIFVKQHCFVDKVLDRFGKVAILRNDAGQSPQGEAIFELRVQYYK
jgi:hypothetical protein